MSRRSKELRVSSLLWAVIRVKRGGSLRTSTKVRSEIWCLVGWFKQEMTLTNLTSLDEELDERKDLRHLMPNLEEFSGISHVKCHTPSRQLSHSGLASVSYWIILPKWRDDACVYIVGLVQSTHHSVYTFMFSNFSRDFSKVIIKRLVVIGLKHRSISDQSQKRC